MSRHWFLFGLFTLPFIFWPWASIPYEIPRVWFFNRWVEVLAVLVLAENLKSKNEPNRKFSFLLIFFVAIALLSSILGADFGKSFWGNYYRGDGLITLFHLGALSLLTALIWEKKLSRRLSFAIAAGTVPLGLTTILLGLKNYLTGDAGFWDGAVGATFGQPNFLGGFLLVTMPFIIYLAKNTGPGQERSWSFAILVQIIAILFTKSIGSIFGILILFLLLLYFLKKFTLRFLMPIFLIIGFSGILFYFLSTQYAAGRNELGYQSRFRLVNLGIQGFTQRPIIGWGWANFDHAFETGGGNYNKKAYVDKAHSNLLEVLVTTGALGFGIYIVLAALTVKVLLNKKGSARLSFEKTLLLSFLLFIFHSQTNVISINEELFFWLILGIAASKKLILHGSLLPQPASLEFDELGPVVQEQKLKHSRQAAPFPSL